MERAKKSIKVKDVLAEERDMVVFDYETQVTNRQLNVATALATHEE